MLICPQCHAENSSINKFCQRCGTSLTEKVCAKCGTRVAVNAQQCPNCSTVTGTFWLAIITNTSIANTRAEIKEREKVAEEIPLPEAETSPPPPLPPSPLPTPLPHAAYLDSEKRYQLLEPLSLTDVDTEITVKVLDCQPFQVSPLEMMVANQSGKIAVELTKLGAYSEVTKAIAQAYIALIASSSYHSIPPIHDAWQEGDLGIILIEDRLSWQRWSDIWQNNQTTSLQIVHWFYEMTQLWEAFEPWHCRQSLLDLENICLDEDEALAIRRLYFSPEKTFTVQDLAKVWQALFRQSQRTQFGSLVQLLSDLDEGVIQTLPDLRSRLGNIAQELQAEPTTDTSTMESMSDPQVQKTSSPTILQSSEDFTSRNDEMPTVVLPMELANLEDAGRTDVGRQRQHNEDCFGIETKINKVESLNNRDFRAHGLYILCDGMGGHAGGEIASGLAVKTLRQYFQANWVADQLPSEANIREAVRLANQAIYDVNQHDSRSGVARMGTTLVLLLVQNNQVAIAHVGDSRLYRLTRKGGIQQLTVDHEVGQREILRGVEPSIAYARPDAYQLTQALGPRDENFINPDVQFLELSEDTLLLLASDGLTDNDLVEQHWHTHLEPLLSSRANLEAGVNELIDLANQYNGHDNITAVLVRAKVRPNLEQQ